MGLKQYQKKRNFRKTKEPKGEKKTSSKGLLQFVIQKHAARQLHYDFRIEHKGVLLSWAVPKRPPKIKRLKRLAIHVEDHPLSYGKFEGTIPEGEYGAGKVEIWDKGTYLFKGTATKKESEKAVQAGLKKGHIALELTGEQLKGTYHLVHLKRGGSKEMWILFKA